MLMLMLLRDLKVFRADSTTSSTSSSYFAPQFFLLLSFYRLHFWSFTLEFVRLAGAIKELLVINLCPRDLYYIFQLTFKHALFVIKLKFSLFLLCVFIPKHLQKNAGICIHDFIIPAYFVCETCKYFFIQ